MASAQPGAMKIVLLDQQPIKALALQRLDQTHNNLTKKMGGLLSWRCFMLQDCRNRPGKFSYFFNTSLSITELATQMKQPCE